MWNIIPQISGALISRHLRISYKAGVGLALLARKSGFSMHRKFNHPTPAQSVPVVILQYEGLRIKIVRLNFGVDVWCGVAGRSAVLEGNIADMRTVLRYIREKRQEYRAQHLEWWSIDSKYIYPYSKKGVLWKLR